MKNLNDVIAMLALPFNEKHWEKQIGDLLSSFGYFRFTNCPQSMWAECLAFLICVFYFSFRLPWSIVLLYLYLIYKISILSMAVIYGSNDWRLFQAVSIRVMFVELLPVTY